MFRSNKILLVSLLLSLFIAGTVFAGPPAQGGVAQISFPTNNQVVRGILSIRGNAVHPAFQRFQIAYAAEPVVNNNQWITIGIERTDQVVNGELAIWDTTQIPDGSYSLRLRVIRQDGNYDEIEVHQIVVANTVPVATPTPEEATPEPRATRTPTPLAATPTIVIEVAPGETATPRSLEITQLPTPRPTNSSLVPIPTIKVDTSPIQSGCVWGGGAMFALFILFGFLSALRIFVMGFAEKTRRKR